MKMNKSTCRNLAIAGIVCAGISLVIGGALLDIVGFVLGFLSFSNSKKMGGATSGDPYVENAYKLAKIAIVVSLVAFIANLLTAVFLAPVLYEQMAGVATSSSSVF